MSNQPDAFVLTGAFWVICRNPLYLTELRRRGLRILVITPSSYRTGATAVRQDPTHPASMIEDIAYVDGSLDKEASFTPAVVAAAQAWRSQYRIVGAYAVGETLVEPTGLVTDALGLATPGLRATRVCRSKYLQRLYLPEIGPASLALPPGRRDVEAEALTFPVVVKPATRHSSSGVQTIADPQQLASELATYPAYETVLVEEKIEGQEFSVESLVQQGRPVFASVTRKETTDSHTRTFVELSHTVPEAPGEVADLITAANQAMLGRLSFEDGVVHSEWRVQQGRAVLMEVAARTPGDGLLVLYQLATGAPMEPAIVGIALREPVTYPMPTRFARQVYLEHEAGGVLEDVSLEWDGVEITWLIDVTAWPEIKPVAADAPPGLRAVFVLKPRGSVLEPLHSSEERAVCFFIDAPSLEELDALEQRVREALTVRTV